MWIEERRNMDTYDIIDAHRAVVTLGVKVAKKYGGQAMRIRGNKKVF